jgi:CheY-like chemotaxis protein
MANVLIVEDEIAVVMVLIDMIEDLGHTVIGPVASVDDGLHMLDTEHVDIALLDVCLPLGNSFPVARELRKRKIPYAFTSGYPQLDEYEFHQDPILRKPYRFPDLENILSQLLSARTLQPA